MGQGGGIFDGGIVEAPVVEAEAGGAFLLLYEYHGRGPGTGGLSGNVLL